MKDYKIRLSEAKIQLVQAGNTLGTTDETEILDISFENQLPGEETFMVLRTSTGWSMNAASDLTQILEQVHKAIDGLREFEV
jgi:predicted nucleotidyltransferase